MSKAKVFPRSASRLIAVQILFSKIFNQGATEPLTIDYCLASKIWQFDIDDIDEVDVKQLDKKFLLDIINGVQEQQEYITNVIKQFLVNVSLEDLSPLTLIILKCAVWELLFNDQTTDKAIVVSQYVSLSSCFYVNNEVSLTNKLLAIISQEMVK